MDLSVAAFIIALCALLWNVGSVIYSWHKAKPAVKVSWLSSSSKRVDNQTGEWLVITVRNIGGAPISVTSIMVWRLYSNNSEGPSKEGFGLQVDEATDGNKNTGPTLPYTIAPNHSQHWKFDVTPYENMLTASPVPEELPIEVTLGTGQVVIHKIRTQEWYRIYPHALKRILDG